MQQETNSASSFDEILVITKDQITKLFPTCDFHFMHYDGKESIFVWDYCLENDQRLLDKEAIPLGQKGSLGAVVLQTQTALLTHDYQSECQKRGIQLLENGIFSWMAAPLVVDKQTIALMSIGSRDPQTCYSDSEFELFKLIAAQVTNALIKLRLDEAVKSNALQLEQIHQLISYLTHEVKTPMTTIKGYSEIIARGMVGDVNQKQSQFLKVIQTSVDKMDSIVSDVDSFSKIQTDDLNYSIEAVDLKHVLVQVRNTLFDAINEKRLEIKSNIEADFPHLWVDQKILTQILTLLFMNAIEFSLEDDFITLSAEVSSQDEKIAHIIIQDHRVALSQSDKQALFDLNLLISEPQKNSKGLSLLIVKGLIDLLGGEIWFESQTDQCSRFHFTLPIAET